MMIQPLRGIFHHWKSWMTRTPSASQLLESQGLRRHVTSLVRARLNGRSIATGLPPRSSVSKKPSESLQSSDGEDSAKENVPESYYGQGSSREGKLCQRDTPVTGKEQCEGDKGEEWDSEQ